MAQADTPQTKHWDFSIDIEQIGWLTLDAQGRIVEASENAGQMFQWGSLIRRGR